MKNELASAARRRQHLRLRLIVAEALGAAMKRQQVSIAALAATAELEARWIRSLLRGEADWDLRQVSILEAALGVDLLRVRRITTTSWQPVTFAA